MKKLSFFPFVAIVLAIVFSAFTNNAKPIKHSDPLWYYTGSTTAGHGTASLYEPFDDQDVDLCDEDESDVRCVIEAPELVIMSVPQGVPDLSGAVNEISFKPE